MDKKYSSHHIAPLESYTSAHKHKREVEKLLQINPHRSQGKRYKELTMKDCRRGNSGTKCGIVNTQ